SSRRRHTRFSRDWSSDVCSSDLFLQGRLGADGLRTLQEAACAGNGALSAEATDLLTVMGEPPLHHLDDVEDGSARRIIAAAVVEIGRASCRERVCGDGRAWC